METWMLDRAFCARLLPLLTLTALVAVPAPAAAQADFSGFWTPRYHEDRPDRIPGPELGDYLGLPINDAARLFAESWNPDRITLPEEQCRVHVAPYIYRGPLQLEIFHQRDPATRELVAIKHRISTYDQERTIYMDGRPHPPDHVPHTWMGFSTGRWQGNMLVVTTTHLKKGWHRRNGVPMSDRATLTEYFIRSGEILTRISAVTDPVYLTEPLVKSEEFVLNEEALPDQAWLFACKPVVEVDREEGVVPHYLPDQNPHVEEFRGRFDLPEAATRGGPETMYPEFRERLEHAR